MLLVPPEPLFQDLSLDELVSPGASVLITDPLQVIPDLLHPLRLRICLFKFAADAQSLKFELFALIPFGWFVVDSRVTLGARCLR